MLKNLNKTFAREKKLTFGDTNLYHIEVRKDDFFITNQIAGKTLHCVDYENVLRIPLQAIQDPNGIMLVFGNVNSSALTNNLIHFCDTVPIADFYVFNTRMIGKDYADIFCGTFLGRIIEGKHLPKEIILYSKDNGFMSMAQALKQQSDISIKICKQFEPVNFTNKRIEIPDAEPIALTNVKNAMINTEVESVLTSKTTLNKDDTKTTAILKEFNDRLEKMKKRHTSLKSDIVGNLDELIKLKEEASALKREYDGKIDASSEKAVTDFSSCIASAFLNGCSIVEGMIADEMCRYGSEQSYESANKIKSLIKIANKLFTHTTAKAKYRVSLQSRVGSATKLIDKKPPKEKVETISKETKVEEIVIEVKEMVKDEEPQKAICEASVAAAQVISEPSEESLQNNELVEVVTSNEPENTQELALIEVVELHNEKETVNENTIENMKEILQEIAVDEFETVISEGVVCDGEEEILESIQDIELAEDSHCIVQEIEESEETVVNPEVVLEKDSAEVEHVPLFAAVIECFETCDMIASKLSDMGYNVASINGDTLCFKGLDVKTVMLVLDTYGVDYSLGNSIKAAWSAVDKSEKTSAVFEYCYSF